LPRHPESLVLPRTLLCYLGYGALALAALESLAGCGRIGPLEPPPEANASVKQASSTAPGSLETISSQAKPKIPPITPPNQPFILDPLLK
jgi:predicted small lipoprotein YifL